MTSTHRHNAVTARVSFTRLEARTIPVERKYARDIAKARTWPAYVAVCAIAAAAGGGLVWMMAAMRWTP